MLTRNGEAQRCFVCRTAKDFDCQKWAWKMSIIRVRHWRCQFAKLQNPRIVHPKFVFLYFVSNHFVILQEYLYVDRFLSKFLSSKTVNISCKVQRITFQTGFCQFFQIICCSSNYFHITISKDKFIWCKPSNNVFLDNS